MAEAETLTIERRGRVAILSFNRPRVLNAFDGPLVEATMEAMAELSADEDVLAIVARGEGRAFSAGFDLKAGAAAPVSANARRMAACARGRFRFHHGVLGLPQADGRRHPRLLHRRRIRIVARLRHHVAAAGTRLGAPEVKFGSGAVAMLLPFITGAKAAKEFLSTGDDHLSAERALALGIVNHVAPAGEELAKALAIAESIAGR